MSVEVVQLTGAEFDEAMEFLDGVFGEHRPHDFATLLPSIYQPTDEDMACNHAVREDGVLRAVVGLFPIDWQVGDRTLKVGGIGGVSTHPSVRGKGYMQLLMKHCVEKMREEDYHLSWLGGQRQRYGYFGYEKCGQSLSVELSPVNLQHASPTVPDLRFEPIEAEDADRIATVQRLHDAQPVRCRRKGPEFHRFLRSWYRRPHAAVDAAGALVGYLVATEDGDGVVELVATDDDTAFDLAVAWVAGREAAASFDLPPTRAHLVRRLTAVGESVSQRSSGNWQIFDWAATTEALLLARHRSSHLADGEVDVGIEDYGVLRMRVRDGQPRCERVEAAATVTWDPLTAMRVLFGPMPPYQVATIPASLAALPAWCPLPLGWTRQDGV